MRTAQFEALLDAAEDGIEHGSLTVERTSEGYRFVVPGVDRNGLAESELHELATDHAPYVTDWYYWDRVVDAADPAREAFLRYVEDADDLEVPDRYDRLRDGMETGWGELSIRTTIDDDGLRRYDLRHEDDVDTARDDLSCHEDPLDVRDVVKTDPKGRYRPLKTAPTLRDGWAIVDLDGHDLVTAVDYVYPATIANWYREREGRLDVTHWRECADRQTGIYELISELDDEAVEWMAEACCVDSQCLRRREWQLDDETELDVDGGDGVFPCREPCSLVVAAARRWTVLEGETERTYEFELTASEKNQLEALIDAVADGRVDEIREADVYEGANRYRTRFLRAKRFDDDGNLCGVPTVED